MENMDKCTHMLPFSLYYIPPQRVASSRSNTYSMWQTALCGTAQDSDSK